MTPQNQDGTPTTGRFTPRQKITAAVVVIVILVVIWQVMGLFGETSSAPPPLVQNKAPNAAQQMGAQPPGAQPGQPGQTAMTAGPPGTPMTPGTPPAGSRPPMSSPQGPPTDPNKLSVSQQQQNIMAQQQDTQRQYVDTINQLQMLKLQRDIDETKQSIAAARLATATAEKNISDLFTRPAAAAASQNPQMSAADYAKLMAGGGANGEKIPPPPIQEVPVVPYTVISVSMRLGHWTAVLGNGGKLYSVSVGDILPLDGSQVVAISKAGVVLKKDNVKRRISVVNSL